MKTAIFGCLVAVGLFGTSCNDFLTLYPSDKIAPAEFFKNEKELILYTNSFLNDYLPSADDIAAGDGVTDIMAIVSVNKYLTSGYNPSDQGGWNWGALRNINYFLDRLKVSPIDENIKNKYMGLAKFWRAWFYFEKVKNFGDVPFYDFCIKASDTEALYKPRDPRTFVMERMLEDMNDAVKYCSDTKDESTTNVTKYVALAFKARVCLHEGTFRKYHPEMNLTDADKWLREAASAAKELMDSRKYSLYNTGKPEQDYRSLFTATNMDGARSVSAEVIWATVFDKTFRRWHNLTWQYNSGTTGIRWTPIRPFVNTYLMQDGSRYTEKAGYETETFANEMKNRDLRLKQTVRTAGYKRSNGNVALADFAVTLVGYHMLKWCLDDPFFDGQAESTNATPVFRYAETLLIYAEAKAELGEFSSAVWDQTIRLLRERAGVSGKEPADADPYLQSTFYSDVTDKFILEIRRERAIELLAENFRYDDLMRWKKGDLLSAGKTTWSGIYIPKLGEGYDLDGDGKFDVCFYAEGASKPNISGVKFVQLGGNLTISDPANGKGYLIWAKDAQREWTDKQYLRPIPRDARVVNPSLTQNPGWGD